MWTQETRGSCTQTSRERCARERMRKEGRGRRWGGGKGSWRGREEKSGGVITWWSKGSNLWSHTPLRINTAQHKPFCYIGTEAVQQHLTTICKLLPPVGFKQERILSLPPQSHHLMVSCNACIPWLTMWCLVWCVHAQAHVHCMLVTHHTYPSSRMQTPHGRSKPTITHVHPANFKLAFF